MDVEAEVHFNQRVMSGLDRIPDDILFTVAKQTLDFSRSSGIIPKNKGKLRTTIVANGVRGGNGDFYIGDSTSYAKYVWNMPESTNWTTKGSNNKWFARTLKTYGTTITNNAVNQAWRKDMQ